MRYMIYMHNQFLNVQYVSLYHTQSSQHCKAGLLELFILHIWNEILTDYRLTVRNPIYEASITLMPKPGKDTTTKKKSSYIW